MKVRSIDILWPYPPSAGRPVEQTDVVVELEDGSRWMSSFHDTHRFNQGVKGFRGLGADRPFRFGPRLVIVSDLSEAAVRVAVEALAESSHFGEAFERIADTPADQ
jgi:hypothetical protein